LRRISALKHLKTALARKHARTVAMGFLFADWHKRPTKLYLFPTQRLLIISTPVLSRNQTYFASFWNL